MSGTESGATITSSGFGSADEKPPEQIPSPANYIKRRIDVVCSLGEGDFGENGANVVTLRGLRVSAQVMRGGDLLPSAQIRIYGMKFDLMNRLTSLGKQHLMYERNNVVTVLAGDNKTGVATIFVGIMQEAWTMFEGAPEVVFNIEGRTGALEKLRPVPPLSYPGSADAVEIMATLAKQMGMKFENHEVPPTLLSNPYFPGTPMMQAEACARAGGFLLVIHDDTLVIVPLYGVRDPQGEIPVIGPNKGMVSYPSYTGSGIKVRSVFNPAILVNGQVKIETDVTPAAGLWVMNRVIHTLEAETPGGDWFTDMEGYRFGDIPNGPG